MIEKYIIYKEYRDGFAPVHVYEVLSECNLMGCLFNKGGCTLFGENDTINEFYALPVHVDCPRIIKVMEGKND